MTSPYAVIEQFEYELCRYTGAPYSPEYPYPDLSKCEAFR